MVDIGTLSLILLIGMFVLLAIGMPLGFASAFLAVATLVMKFGPDVLFGTFGRGPLNVLGQAIYRQMTNYVLISVPMFIFMAALLERSGIARDMYSSLNVWLSRTRGGIALVTSIMAVIMAAMSGIIGGEVVLLGLIALPQMLRLGYNQNLAIGTICASGSLGTMIPPSIVLIFYGLITETSIQALFTAAFLPGFMLASFYMHLHPDPARTCIPSRRRCRRRRPDDPPAGGEALLFLNFLSILVAIASGVLLAAQPVPHRHRAEQGAGGRRCRSRWAWSSDLPWIGGTFGAGAGAAARSSSAATAPLNGLGTWARGWWRR